MAFTESKSGQLSFNTWKYLRLVKCSGVTYDEAAGGGARPAADDGPCSIG